jgi:tetratricopeptide (TPR) repeat protein
MGTHEKKLEKAHEFYKNGEWNSVVKELEQLLSDTSTEKKIRITAYLLGSSALRNLKETDRAIHALKKGLSEYPEQVGMLHNLGNCYRDRGGDARWKAYECYLNAVEMAPNNEKFVLSLTRNLLDLSFPGLAYQQLQTWMSTQASNSSPSAETLSLLLELVGRVMEPPVAQNVGKWCLDHLGQLAGNDLNGQAGVAIYRGRLGQTKEALAWFNKAQATLADNHQQALRSPREDRTLANQEQTIINAGWNLSCHLLKHGQMADGWRLYNYGLQTPAAGLQRWQRALPKPFNHQTIPIWDGSPLENRRLLLMGEQAIGDSMMFLRLLPILLKESSAITLMLPNRLVPIYQRSFPSLSVVSDGLGDHQLNASDFDLQIPCGSVPALRMEQWIKGDWEQTPLKANPDMVDSLRQKYRADLGTDQPLIGISWLGGGKTERIRTKSMPSDQFLMAMKKIPSARFISLQYGNCKRQIEIWQHQGLDIHWDQEINPLKSMDDWLAQVACCDAVVSVANTTIHGAGGLGKPTMCLQSRTTDWRWIDGLNQSYWYDTVDAVSQSKDGSWDNAIEQLSTWAPTINTANDHVRMSKAERQQICIDAMTFSEQSS